MEMMIARPCRLIIPSSYGMRASNRMGRARADGFTLIELIIVVVIVGILFAVAMPQLNNMISEQRVRSASNNIYASLIFARSEAIKRSQFVAVCAQSNDGTTCRDSTDWAGGWIVFVDGDGDGYPGAASNIIRRQDALSGVTLNGTGTNVSYQRDGRLRATVTAFVASTAPANNVIQARCVNLDLSGRPKSVTDTDNNAANGCQ